MTTHDAEFHLAARALKLVLLIAAILVAIAVLTVVANALLT